MSCLPCGLCLHPGDGLSRRRPRRNAICGGKVLAGAQGATLSVNCGLVGQYVSVRVMSAAKKTDRLTLCDISVLGK